MMALQAQDIEKRRAFVAEQRYFRAEEKVRKLREQIEALDREIFYASKHERKLESTRDQLIAKAMKAGCTRDEAIKVAAQLMSGVGAR